MLWLLLGFTLLIGCTGQSCNDGFLAAIKESKDDFGECTAATALTACVEKLQLSGTALEDARASADQLKSVVLARTDCSFLRRSLKNQAQVRTADGNLVLSVPQDKDITFEMQDDISEPVSIFRLVSSVLHISTCTQTEAEAQIVPSYLGSLNQPNQWRSVCLVRTSSPPGVFSHSFPSIRSFHPFLPSFPSHSFPFESLVPTPINRRAQQDHITPPAETPRSQIVFAPNTKRDTK